MDSSLSPRTIQARIRAGATVEEIAAEVGMDEARLRAFAGPVIAEREHMARQALSGTVRRPGETGVGSVRRLGQLVTEHLQTQGIDADLIIWDARRQPDLRWRVVGTLSADGELRTAEFLFDSRGRFSTPDNTDARWMIGEEVPGARRPANRLVSADPVEPHPPAPADTGGSPGPRTTSRSDPAGRHTGPSNVAPGPVSTEPSRRDDAPVHDIGEEPGEETSQLDELYDMLSGISEDSVHLYTGVDRSPGARAGDAGEETSPDARQKKPGRAHVPSWEEIMFGMPRTPRQR